MPRTPKGKSSWLAILILIAAIGVQAYNQYHKEKSAPTRTPSSPVQAPTQPRQKSPAQPPVSTRPKSNAPSAEKPADHQGNYEIYRNCTLAEHHANDGDSFLTLLPDGRKVTLRLYYVDTPESQFRRYQNGQTNYERIRQQAAEMGGITPEQAVEIGTQAKHYTLALLAGAPFTIYTQWDSPFNDERYHAFIEVMENGRKRWLHETLIEKGLVRLKTKPAPLPDGTPVARHMAYLRQLQVTARQNKAGVWKY